MSIVELFGEFWRLVEFPCVDDVFVGCVFSYESLERAHPSGWFVVNDLSSSLAPEHVGSDGAFSVYYADPKTREDHPREMWTQKDNFIHNHVHTLLQPLSVTCLAVLYA